MFEKYVERLLTRYLAPYVDGISKDHFDILKGDVLLNNLTIKKEAFDFLKSSGVLLHTGKIKQANLKIPWRSLTSGKIAIDIDTIAVDVGRIQGDIPDEADILTEFRSAKAAQVAKKVAHILELKEVSENLNAQSTTFGGRFLHRIIQNLVVNIKHVAIRLVDLKQDLIVGFLLGSLSVYTVGARVEPTTKNSLRKQVDIEDLATFCRVAQQPLRYILEPTVLSLRIDHIQSALHVKLELHDEERKTGGLFSVSKCAMTRLITALQELQAWQGHLSDVVAKQCQCVPIDQESLNGVTKDNYIHVWRMHQTTMIKDALPVDMKDPPSRQVSGAFDLQTMEDAVPARYLALWRIEVQNQLKSAEQHKLKAHKASKKGWWPFSGSDAQNAHKTEDLVLSDEDWEDIKKKVEREQASLAELDDPQTKEISIELKSFGVQLYDDGQSAFNIGKAQRSASSISNSARPKDNARTSTETVVSQPPSDLWMPTWIEYVELCDHLRNEDYQDSIIHKFSVTVANVRANVNLQSHIVETRERSEWSFGAQLGYLNVSLDQETMLRFGKLAQEEDKVSMTASTSSGHWSNLQTKMRAKTLVLTDHIALYSRAQPDGRELITTSVRLPPVIVTVSPTPLKLAIDLMRLDLPEPPTFGRTDSYFEDTEEEVDVELLACESHTPFQIGAENHELMDGCSPTPYLNPPASPESLSKVKSHRKTQAPTSPNDTNTAVSGWAEEEQERILETVYHEINRVKEGALTFEIDISIAAPQVTIVVDDCSQIHIDLGFLNCVSDDAMTVDDFNVRLDLKDTHIVCTIDRAGVEKHLIPVLEPISLFVTLKGEHSHDLLVSQSAHDLQSLTTSSFTSASKRTPSLKVTADVMLEKLQLKVYPDSSHLFLRLPRVYSMLFSSDQTAESGQGVTSPNDETLGRFRFSSDQSTAARDHDTAMQPAVSESSTAEDSWHFHGSLAIELVRLAVFDIQGQEVARTDVVEMLCDAKSGLTETTSTMSLRHILVEVGGQPLVYMKDRVTPIVAHAAKQMADRIHGTRNSEKRLSAKVASGINAKISIPTKQNTCTRSAAHVEICPIVVSWRKQAVASLYAVVLSCMLPKKTRKERSATHRSTLAPPTPRLTTANTASTSPTPRTTIATTVSPFRPSVDSTVLRARSPGSVGDAGLHGNSTAERDRSKELAASGLNADAPLPALKAPRSEKTAQGILAVDILFGGLAIELHASAEEQMFISPAWRGFRDAPLMYLSALGVKLHYEQYDAEESSGNAVLQEVFFEYDGQRMAAPWQDDKALLEFDFSTYNTRGHDDPVYSFCLKGLIRKVSLVYFQKQFDSLISYLTDNILGALVTAAATQAAEAVQHQAEAKILLWNIDVESPVVYLSRDIEVLHQSPTWAHTKCSLPPAPPKADTRHPTPIATSFPQCVVLQPGTIQARSCYELDTWASRIHVDFQDCHVSVVDGEGYGVGPICDLFHWELTIRPTSANPPNAMHVAAGLYFHPVTINISQAQFIVIMSTLNENLAYSRYFPTAAVQAPEGAAVAQMPNFAARYYAEDGDTDSDIGSSESSEYVEQFEYLRINVRFEFRSMHITAAYSTPGLCSTADAEKTPVARLGATDVRMTFDGVSYYEGQGFLFSYGFFVNNIYVDDLRPDRFRKSCHERVLVCRSEGSSFAARGSSDRWHLVVDREEGETPWLPQQAALQVIFTQTSAQQSICTLKVEHPRLFCAVQLIMDSVLLVVNAFMECTLVQYASAPVVSPMEAEESLTGIESIKHPMIITFNFRFEGLALYLMTNCMQPTSPLIEVVFSLGAEFDLVLGGETLTIHEVDVSNVSVNRCEDFGEGVWGEEGQILNAGKTDSVRLVQLTKLTTVGSIGLAPRPCLNILVHAMPLSVRLSTRDVPYLLAAGSNIGADGEPLCSIFSMERRRFAATEGECSACGTKLTVGMVFCKNCGMNRSSFVLDGGESCRKRSIPASSSAGTFASSRDRAISVSANGANQYSSPAANSIGTLKICAMNFFGVDDRIHVPRARPADQQVWVTAEFVGHDAQTVLHWGVMMELSVPAKNQGLLAFGDNRSGLEVNEEGVMLQLRLWRGARHETECLGELSFPVGLCIRDGLHCRRHLRPTSFEHSMFAARERLVPLELEFEARFEEVHGGRARLSSTLTFLDFSVPKENLEDFVRPMETLADFLEVPVPLGPSLPECNEWRRGSHASTARQLSSSQASAAATSPFSVRAFLSIDRIEVLFLDDCQAKALPVLRFFLRAKSKIGSDGAPSEPERQTLQGALGAEGAGGILMQLNPWEDLVVQRHGLSVRIEDCSVGAQYLNSKVGSWEPFLEQWSFDFFLDTEGDLATGAADPSSNAEFTSNYSSALTAKLVSFKPILVNVTPQLCTLASWLLNNKETYMAEFRGQDCIGSSKKRTDLGDARYRLLNLSGHPIRLVLFRPRSQEEITVHSELFGDGCDSASSSMADGAGTGSLGASSRSLPHSSKKQAASDHLRWHLFEPCDHEIDLDPLLGHRTAEEWRELADEAVTCAVEMVNETPIVMPVLPDEIVSTITDGTGIDDYQHCPSVGSTFSVASTASRRSRRSTIGISNPYNDAKRILLSLSSASEGVLPVESVPTGVPMHASCEVMAPHPSYHLLVVSSGLRIFNHTGRVFHIFYRAGDAILPLSSCSDADGLNHSEVLAAPFSFLPLRGKMPREVASALRIHSASARSEGETMQEHAAEDIFAHAYSAQRMAQGKSTEHQASDDSTANAQWLKPQYFCGAPLNLASVVTAIQVGLPGNPNKSEPIALEAEDSEASSRHEEVLIKDNRSMLRFHTYIIHAPENSLANITSVHIYTPLRLINATPVKLQFVFEVLQLPDSPGTSGSSVRAFSGAPPFFGCEYVNRFVIDVDALSDCDLPPDIDPSQPYGVSLMIPSATNTYSAEFRHHSPPVPHIFDTSSVEEELVAVPLGENETDKRGEEVLMLSITRGLICSVTCHRWLIDRTGLGLRVIHSMQLPTATNLALPQLDGHVTLLSPIFQKSFQKTYPELKRMRYFLAVPSDGIHGWTAVGPVKLPDTSDDITFASLTVPLAEGSDSPTSPKFYPVHVCLHAEALSRELTFGALCHIISVLPQVIIYNKIADDGIDVRAIGDPHTEILVEPRKSAQFLQWQPTRNAKHTYARSKLLLEFRPLQLKDHAHWSAPIKISSNRCISQSVVFQSTLKHMKLPNMLRMYMVEVAEQEGVVCFTVTRGSRCELRNFSRLVEKVSITPRPLEWLRQRGAPKRETFVVRSCETVDFAWPSQESELQLDVVLHWIKEAGYGTTTCVIPDVYKPARLVFAAPGGWVSVVVRTGCTDDITWLQVQDLQNMADATRKSSFVGTFTQMLGLEAAPSDTQRAQLKLGVTLSGVGLSVVSELRERELVYAELQQVGVLVGMWDDRWSLEVLISDVQVDCQLLDFEENPVMLANRGEQRLPWLQVKVTQRLPTSRYGISLPLVGSQIDCMEVDLNDELLLEVMGCFSRLLDLVYSSQGVTREQLNMWRTRPLTGSFESPPAVPMQVTLDEFVFLGLEVHLWAKVKITKMPYALRKPFQLLNAGSDSFFVDGATLRMSPEVFDGVQGAAPRVIRTLMERYYWNFFVSLGSVLGRSSLFMLPAVPMKWGRRGVQSAMSAADFIIHRTADIFEILTLDEQYQRRKQREHQQRLRDITGLRSGLSTAALHLGSGLLHISDIVREPIVGAQHHGFTGFVAGIGRGLLSTVVKPVIEMGFGARAIIRGIRVRVQSHKQNKARRVTMRRRPPRVMYGAGGIREYDEAAALLTLEVATAMPVPGCSDKDLVAIEQAKFGITDHVVVDRSGATPYIRHLLLLVTQFQLLLVVLDSKGIAVRWAVPLAFFRGARASSHGVIVWEQGHQAPIKVPSRDGLIGHQVPCTDAAVISQIFRLLQDVQAKGISSGMASTLEIAQTARKHETKWERIRRGLQRMKPKFTT